MSDAVTRLTPMAVMVLALLAESDMHPYEMVRLLRLRRDERLVKVTNGTLYHSVARLLEQGLIVEVGTDRDGNRPERTTYSLAEPGSAALVAWVRYELGRIDRPAQFRVALAEAHNLDRLEVLHLLRARCAALEEEQRADADALDLARQVAVPDQFLLEAERHLALLEADLAWQRTLLFRLGEDSIPWGPTGFTNTHRYSAQRKAAQQ